MMRCTVGVFAHNEVANIRHTLQAVLTQECSQVSIVEVIVLASDCTDGTVEAAEQIARQYPIVSIEVERTRTGKAAAMKKLMTMACGDFIVFVGADTVPAPTALEHLLAPFDDPTVGMTGARVVPLNAPTEFMGFAVQMLWNVHHHLALRKPKLGELVACRNVVDDFPQDTSTDDLALEAFIAKRRYRLVYAPRAVVYNRGPENMHDFLVQRRRIFEGELRIALRYHYLASSLRLRHVLPLAIEAVRSHPHRLLWTIGVMGLELWARLLGTVDVARGRDHVVWLQARSTKEVMRTSDPGMPGRGAAPLIADLRSRGPVHTELVVRQSVERL